MHSILVLFLVSLVMNLTMSVSSDGHYQSSNRRGRNNHKSSQRRGDYIRDPDRVVFPDDLFDEKNWTPSNRNSVKNTTRNELPLNLATRLNELGDLDAFLEEFIDNKEQYYNDNNIPGSSVVSLGSRSGSPNKSSKGGFSVKQVCSPVPTTIRLAPENHPSDVLYFPECAHVKRCSGCCNTGVLSCQPLKTSNVTFKVYENRLLPNKMKLRYNKSFNVEIEEHLSCGCRCRVQAHHCQNTQRYESHSCRCVCNDNLPSSKNDCEAYGKIWNEDDCSCDCPEHVNTDCTSESNFDDDACACMKK